MSKYAEELKSTPLSSENNDMECPIRADDASDMSSVPAPAADHDERPADAETEALPCVWTGDPANGCSCTSSIPEHVVTAAWRRELEQAGERADRFFSFLWQNDTWLAYGLMDGRVRGVHCPPHRAEREARTTLADEHVDEFALYA
jgi:hypothetical protein